MGLLEQVIAEGFKHNQCESSWASIFIQRCLHISKQFYFSDILSNSTQVAASRISNLRVSKFITQNHIMDKLQGRQSQIRGHLSCHMRMIDVIFQEESLVHSWGISTWPDGYLVDGDTGNIKYFASWNDQYHLIQKLVTGAFVNLYKSGLVYFI